MSITDGNGLSAADIAAVTSANNGFGFGRGRSPVTGRYISNGMSDPMYGNSFNSYYSGHSIKDRMVAKLEEMYDEAKTSHEKEMVDSWINRIRSEN